MAGVAGLQQANNINGCDTAGQHSSPANTAGNPAECRTFEAIAERERIADLRQIHSRINRLCERFELIRSATQHQQEAIKSVISAAKDQQAVIATLTEAVQQLQADAIDRNERELNAAHEAMEAKAAEGMANAYTAAVDRAKRTIKGGWANVYLRDFGRNICIGAIHQSKADADRTFGDDPTDHRIACIQIPDITEGEGL